MAFERPTLAQLIDRIQQDFVSRMELAGAVLRRSIVLVLSRVLAGAAHMLHGHLEYLYRQIFPDTADDANLARWGSLLGIARKSPSFAAGTVTFTGSNGWVIAALTKLIRADGTEYETAAEVTITGGTATATATALVAGATGNCARGTEISFESPIAGVDATAIAEDGLSEGADEEGLEEYRARVVDRLRNAPHGGAEEDYPAWAKEVPGVTRAWVYPLGLGAGTVVVRFMRDDDDAATPIPDSAEVAAVQSYINARRPVTAAVTVAAPIADTLNLTLSGLSPDTPDVRAAAAAELADLLQREAEPGGRLPISKLRTAIGIAEGVDDFTLVSPSVDVTPATGHIPVLGTITWV